nr:MAG TPA: hypothetical protein [Caudoviricetes sp.]
MLATLMLTVILFISRTEGKHAPSFCLKKK